MHYVECVGCHRKNAKPCVPIALCPDCKLVVNRYLKAHMYLSELFEKVEKIPPEKRPYEMTDDELILQLRTSRSQIWKDELIEEISRRYRRF